MAIENLYDEVMMDHIKNARNYREIPHADRKTSAVNRLCGDEITVYLKFHGEHIEDAAFRCSSCGISMASASIMTEAVRGRSRTEARSLSQAVRAVIDGEPIATLPQLSPELASALPAVAAFPARKTCAALAWHALSAALDSEQETISVG